MACCDPPCNDCQDCVDGDCVQKPTVDCDDDCDCGDPNCWDCVDGSCECDITINSVSSDKDFACVGCNISFIANVAGIWIIAALVHQYFLR